jgi:uncharacterized oxidoreductase
MPTVDPDDLEPFIARLAEATGADADVATQLAESLVLANLRGHDSHGVRRMPMYYAWSNDDDAGFPIEPSSRPTVVSESATAASVDGRNAYGQAAGRLATDRLVKMATESGVAVVGIRDATHLGRIGEWAERAAEAGLLFGAFVNTQGGHQVAPPGSAQRRYATNPLAFGVPTFDALPHPIVLDIATSQVAYGKIRERRPTGEPVEAAWTVREDGSSVGDAEEFVSSEEGALLPLGGREAGYKGFGLAMIAELFAGIAGDGVVVSQTDGELRGNAALFFALDPTTLSTPATVESHVASLAEYIHATEFSPDVPAGAAARGDEALLPGEAEHVTTEERLADGIPLPEGDAAALVELAEELGVTEIPSALRA